MTTHVSLYKSSKVIVLAAVIWAGTSIVVAAQPAAAQVKNLKWKIRSAAVHGRFDVDINIFKPLLEQQATVLIRKKSPRIFKRFSVLLRRYERGRLVSDKVQLGLAKRGVNRITFDIRGRIVADRFARVLRRKRRRLVKRWVRRGSAQLARFRLTGHATISLVQGERLSGRFLRIVVRGRRLRAALKLPIRVKLALKLANRQLTTRRLAVLNKRQLRRHPLLRSARLVTFLFQRSGTQLIHVRFVAR